LLSISSKSNTAVFGSSAEAADDSVSDSSAMQQSLRMIVFQRNQPQQIGRCNLGWISHVSSQKSPDRLPSREA
ncbi:hypothetical protein, partial [Tardiphaga sp.]|uniref:hypothetical protein n=1 Tax=Tardiphaga sp. TaxID=1926292 RepID=UPI0025FD7C2F